MDSFEVNKILGAVLGTLTFVLALSIGTGILFGAHAPEKPGYELPSPAEDAGEAAATDVEAETAAGDADAATPAVEGEQTPPAQGAPAATPETTPPAAGNATETSTEATQP